MLGCAERGCRAGACLRQRLPGSLRQGGGALCGGGPVDHWLCGGRPCAGTRQPRMLARVHVRVQQAGEILWLPDQLPALRLALAAAGSCIITMGQRAVGSIPPDHNISVVLIQTNPVTLPSIIL